MDYFEISGGIAYDEIGVRFNEGKLSFSQRFFQGFGLTTFFPMFENSDETYRNYTFSSALPDFSERDDNHLCLYDSSLHLGIGGTISVAFDFNYFFKRVEEIFGQ